MIRKTLLATAILALALPAFARPTELKDIQVTADLDAIQNPAAARYWSNVAADLQDALAARLVDHIAPDQGATLKIDIDELALANGFTSEAVLTGQVNLSSAVDNTDFDAYKLTVSATAADAASYQAMIRAFADNVAQRIE